MDSKKKMFIAIGIFAIVLLAAVIAVVAVLAAQQVSIKSQVDISYVADSHVIGSVSAKYETENGTKKDLGSITFEGGESNGTTNALSDIGDLKLESNSNDYVDFTFTFVNGSSIAKYTAVLAFIDGDNGKGNIDNMLVQGRASSVNEFSNIVIDDYNHLTQIEVPVSSTVIYVVRVSIDSPSKDATFEGTLLWDIVTER